ncbi:membrane peptidoglycan carboxypeptidase [Saccharopolyspora lacisalsi]|uniref:Membrane peptidoglycan carboxypeptidase n=1 Tax=Halosaccharopolyspora lacisalsi TaxID=1000566 RepID=A0A839DZC2_9PSEU|nr:transglycosylase domain-containing protein [Halosaccharopolyspora lacisalsi]MBA8827292.1 membrane peptidoglycan carboxypeptidase [Halosaccharopolyspora lacisalsi]
MNDERDDRAESRHSRQPPPTNREPGRPGERGTPPPNQQSPQQPPQRPDQGPPGQQRPPQQSGRAAWPEEEERGTSGPPQGQPPPGQPPQGQPPGGRPEQQGWPTTDPQSRARGEPPRSGPQDRRGAPNVDPNQETAQHPQVPSEGHRGSGAPSPDETADDSSPIANRLSGGAVGNHADQPTQAPRSAQGPPPGQAPPPGQGPPPGQQPPHGRNQPPPPGGQPPRPPGDQPTRQPPQGPPPPPPGQQPTRQSASPQHPGERPTENLPPTDSEPPTRHQAAGGAAAAGAAGGAAAAGGGPARDPGLITHRSEQGGYNYYSNDEHDEGYEDEDYFDDDYGDDDYGDDDYGDPDDEMNAAQAKKARRRKIWRRVRRTCYGAAALMFIVPTVMFVVLYYNLENKPPAKVQREYNTSLVVKYADGSLLNKFSSSDSGHSRVLIKDLDEVSGDMKHATMAAESADFYSNPGFSPTGIARAVLNQLTGGQGGGSTITQQYIKLSTGNDDHTMWRKFTEVVRAFKLTNNYDKNTIFKAYLNTAYYGRGAYGIHNAADAYFGKTPKQLNAAESAVLAGMVQLPRGNDPRVNPEQAQHRWEYVIGQMADNGWIRKNEEKTLEMPKTKPRMAWRGEGVTGAQLHIKQQVTAELEKKGYPYGTLTSQGYQVVTTIDPQAQRKAVAAVDKVTKGQPENLDTALVATDPKTGAVRAYYGGGGVGTDWAAAPQQPGSSFKPFVTMAGLQQNKGIGRTYDGSEPQTIGGTKYVNAEGVDCKRPKQCGVREATTKSVNTVFVNMAMQFGPDKVAEAAHEAGIPRERGGKSTLVGQDGVPHLGIALGQYRATTTNMSNAYGALADGMRTKSHFVAKIVDSNGKIIEDFTGSGQEPAFASSKEESRNLAANVTASMLNVADHAEIGVANDKRPVASKTGTHQNGDTGHNLTAWMVGYTPQISTAVSMSANSKNGQESLLDSKGSDVFGSELPGHIWQEFMTSYLQGKSVKQFPNPDPVGQWRTPPPTPTEKPTSSTKPPPTTTKPPPTTTMPPTSSSDPSASESSDPSASRTEPTEECSIWNPDCQEGSGSGSDSNDGDSNSDSDNSTDTDGRQNAVGSTGRPEGG